MQYLVIVFIKQNFNQFGTRHHQKAKIIIPYDGSIMENVGSLLRYIQTKPESTVSEATPFKCQCDTGFVGIQMSKTSVIKAA